MPLTTLSQDRVSDAELQAAVEAVLQNHRGAPARVQHFAHRPSPYRTSAALEEITVQLEDGTCLDIMFKDAGRDTMHERARRAKPPFVHDPRREIDTYGRLLAGRGLGTADYYGAVVDDDAGRYWLFLELVSGIGLQQVGDVAIWQRVAAWLAGMHASFDGLEIAGTGVLTRAIKYDAAYCRVWLDRARRFFAGSPSAASGLAWLAARHERVATRLAALPVTCLHGEFYPSNILIQETPGPLRICVVDWEMVAIGPGLIDIAALTAGDWSAEDRTAIAMAYYDSLPQPYRTSRDQFIADLTCCRIQLAIQWLGWFGRRLPPAEHTQDWLGEAIDAARQLEL